jgi:FtsP/CotA-like multicopper oxidase with cupredoxin domain
MRTMLLPRTAIRRGTVLTASLAFALAACGSSSDSKATSTTSTAASSTTVAATGTSGSASTTTKTSAKTDSSTSKASGPIVIEATVANGKVQVAKDEFDVTLGSAVSIRVTTDKAEPVHLHGYDKEVDAEPGAPAQIDFVADVPGTFEVELEDSGTLLFEIKVS